MTPTMKALQRATVPMSPQEIADDTDQSKSTVYVHLRAMLAEDAVFRRKLSIDGDRCRYRYALERETLDAYDGPSRELLIRVTDDELAANVRDHCDRADVTLTAFGQRALRNELRRTR